MKSIMFRIMNLKELHQLEEEIDQMADRETDASYQRFKEIIEKHRSE